MAMVICFLCEGKGHVHGRVCCYCDGITVVENGEHLPPDQRPVDGAVVKEWPEEPTQEMPAYRGRPGQEAA